MSEYTLVKGALKLQGLLDELCVESVQDLVKVLPKYLSVEIPSSVSNVVVSNQQPGPDQRQSLWVRLDNASNFVGLYVYAVGTWRPVSPVPNQVFRIADSQADSRNPPEGFKLATEAGFLSESQKTFLKAQWHWHNDVVNTYYDIFDVFFTGY
jgi:hypothetical protein